SAGASRVDTVRLVLISGFPGEAARTGRVQNSGWLTANAIARSSAFNRLKAERRAFRLHAPQADGVVFGVGLHGRAVGAPPGVVAVIPGAAADDALRRFIRIPTAAISRSAGVVLMPAVADELPQIAVHVVESPRIGFLGADGRIISGSVAGVPAEFVEDAGF